MVSAAASDGIPNASKISVMEPRTMGASDTGKFAVVKGLFGRELSNVRPVRRTVLTPAVREGRPFDQGDRVFPEVVGHSRVGLELVQRPRRGKLAAVRAQLLRIERERLGRILQGLVDVVAAGNAARQVGNHKLTASSGPASSMMATY